MKFTEQHKILKEQLQGIYEKNEAAAIADQVMEHFTGLNKAAFITKTDQSLPGETFSKISTATRELLEHKPVQYVLGQAWFYNRKFYVNENVLIPRPETEELVDWIIKDAPPATSILDIGTGSGCIAITLKKEIPGASVSAIDTSDPAIKIAMQNAAAAGADILFKRIDFLDNIQWKKMSKYDIIVSNPPYIPLTEKTKLEKHVTDWEPGTALFVPGNDPLLFYREIILFAEKHLSKTGMIFLECHQHYAKDVEDLFVNNGYHSKLKKDISGNERMIKASFPRK